MRRADFFDRMAPHWDSQRRSEMTGRLARIVREAGVMPGSAVLDVGTGTGVLVPFIRGAAGSAGRVLAVDISLPMLQEARGKLAKSGALFAQANVHHLCAPDRAFDCVICNAAFPHFEDRAAAVDEMVRVLRPGGSLVISHPIGRRAVNARHRAAGGPVGEDRVPSTPVMRKLLLGAGLEGVTVTDEPEFYLAGGRKAP